MYANVGLLLMNAISY